MHFSPLLLLLLLQLCNNILLHNIFKPKEEEDFLSGQK